MPQWAIQSEQGFHVLRIVKLAEKPIEYTPYYIKIVRDSYQIKALVEEK
jgi:hypothetical protein